LDPNIKPQEKIEEYCCSRMDTKGKKVELEERGVKQVGGKRNEILSYDVCEAAR
jgi:hypothetical protein